MQFGYTTVFGWYAAFLLLRTGNLWGVVAVHSFCNWMGLPRVWGKIGGVVIKREVVGGPVQGKEDRARRDEDARALSNVWTTAYYIVLFVGAMTWWKALWILSESERELMKIV